MLHNPAHICMYVAICQFYWFRISGIKEVGTHVVAIRLSDNTTLSKQLPVSLIFKLLPVSLSLQIIFVHCLLNLEHVRNYLYSLNSYDYMLSMHVFYSKCLMEQNILTNL